MRKSKFVLVVIATIAFLAVAVLNLFAGQTVATTPVTTFPYGIVVTGGATVDNLVTSGSHQTLGNMTTTGNLSVGGALHVTGRTVLGNTTTTSVNTTGGNVNAGTGDVYGAGIHSVGNSTRSLNGITLYDSNSVKYRIFVTPLGNLSTVVAS